MVEVAAAGAVVLAARVVPAEDRAEAAALVAGAAREVAVPAAEEVEQGVEALEKEPAPVGREMARAAVAEDLVQGAAGLVARVDPAEDRAAEAVEELAVRAGEALAEGVAAPEAGAVREVVVPVAEALEVGEERAPVDRAAEAREEEARNLGNG